MRFCLGFRVCLGFRPEGRFGFRAWDSLWPFGINGGISGVSGFRGEGCRCCCFCGWKPMRREEVTRPSLKPGQSQNPMGNRIEK